MPRRVKLEHLDKDFQRIVDKINKAYRGKNTGRALHMFRRKQRIKRI